MKNRHIIYLHGVNGENSKKGMLINAITPKQTPHSPKVTLQNIERDFLTDNTIIVGSSRGGLLALFLSLKHHLPLIVINPAIEQSSINKVIYGENCDNELTQISLYVKENIHNLRYDTMLILSKNDEIIDYRNANKLINCESKIFINEIHRIANFELLVPLINYKITKFINKR